MGAIMKTNPNDLAYPSHQALEDKSPNYEDKRNRISGGGLTKREQFAAMAMQGLLAMGPIEGSALVSIEDKSKHCVRLADSLIEALNKDQK